MKMKKFFSYAHYNPQQRRETRHDASVFRRVQSAGGYRRPRVEKGRAGSQQQAKPTQWESYRKESERPKRLSTSMRVRAHTTVW